MMTLAVHELSHNLGFKKRLYNRLCAIFANLPMGIPAAVSFRRYHLEHHRYQGDDNMDVDVPTYAEGYIVGNNPLLKIVWMFLQPAFYSLRPLFIAPKGRSFEEFVTESRHHGWPSFRDEEVVWDNVRCLEDGECVSIDGTHLGHNLPSGGTVASTGLSRKRNRYCINLVSVAGNPAGGAAAD